MIDMHYAAKQIALYDVILTQYFCNVLKHNQSLFLQYYNTV